MNYSHSPVIVFGQVDFVIKANLPVSVGFVTEADLPFSLLY